MKIGILDDNPSILDVFTIMLELEGHTVTAHTSSSSLLDVLFHNAVPVDPIPYDLLILDLLLPGGMSGADIYLLIRKSISAEKLPIIFVTAAGEKDLQSLLGTHPNVPLLRKPIRRQDLLNTINAFLMTVGL
jgi:CheY-like chemotaxis protein